MTGMSRKSAGFLASALNAVIAFVVLTLQPGAHAAWPGDGPIKIIVPQATGGTNDTVGRLIAAELGKRLDQTVIVENRPGAAGAIGTQAIAQARPDGYTLGVASDSSSLLDVLKPALPWKFGADLQGIAMVGEQPIAVAVPAASSYRSIADLLKDAKARPGEVPYGTSGVGSVQHVVGEWFAREAGIKLIHVPYKGGGQAKTDLVANQIPLVFLGLAPIYPQASSGQVRILALTSIGRHKDLPEVQTLTELGFPKIALAQWVGIVAPKGLPADVTDRLSKAIVDILAMPQVRARLEQAGIDPRPLPAARFDTFLKDVVERWRTLIPTLTLDLN